MSITADRPLAVYYEHPDWFRPLFAELERRGLPFFRLHAAGRSYDAAAGEPPWSLVLNRMSPSAWLRGRAGAIAFTAPYLEHLERLGVRVVNGSRAWAVETSKARQLELLERLGLPYPRARVIHDARDAADAARGFRYPVVVKPNIGGSGAGVTRFDTPAELTDAAERGALDLGIDGTALVQEFIPPAHGRIIRVEVLDGRFLYAIRVYTTGDTFDLCPADVCLGVDGAELERAACPADAPRNGLRVEGFTPPPDAIADAERIAAAAGIEVGGIEYVIDARDGRRYYYDVNALSNFVADAPHVVGFDPFARLVDWLVRVAEDGDVAHSKEPAADPRDAAVDDSSTTAVAAEVA